MNEHIAIHATTRNCEYDLTTSIPAIVYGQKKTPQPILLERKAIDKVFNKNAFHTHIIDLTIDGQTTQTVLKSWQIAALSREVIHLDFCRISSKAEITIAIPIHLQGLDKNKALKKEDGVLENHLTELEVSCLPKNIPEHIVVDISKLPLNESIHLSQVSLPKNVKAILIVDETHDPAILTIQSPKGAPSADDDEATPAA